MSKSFVAKVIVVVSLFSVSTLSGMASAEAFASYKEVPGVVTKVDAAESTITIKTEEGTTKTFNVVKGAKVATEKGRAMSLGALAKGDTVVLKNRVSNPIASETKEQVLSANK
jgi:predicted RNA-binding protein